jgi:putative zinc finger protein
MTLLTCAAVERRLAAFHDSELPVGEMIAVEGHVQTCPPCARRLGELRAVGDLLRAAAAPAPSDDWTGLQPGVISRMRAEAHESLAARADRMFEDMHLVWIGLASTAATFLCGAIVLGMLQFASPERNDSLAGMMAVFSAPLGSDLNPTQLDGSTSVPSTVPGDEEIQATLAGSSSPDNLVLPLTVVVTREGRVSGVAVLANDHGGDVRHVLYAISRTRLQPAQTRDGPVAVSLVWVLTHMTVKGKLSS